MEPHGWIQGAYAARPIDRSLAHARAAEAVNLCHEGRSSDLIPALHALCLTSAEDADVVVAEDAGRRLIAESVRIGSLTGRCAGELGLAGVMPAGSPQAAAHAKRAMELARSSRTRMMLVTSTVSYIEHVQAFDRARAEAALRDLLLDRAAMSEVLYIHMAIAVCARLHARTGSPELAIKLGRGPGRRCHHFFFGSGGGSSSGCSG